MRKLSIPAGPFVPEKHPIQQPAPDQEASQPAPMAQMPLAGIGDIDVVRTKA